MNCITLYFKVYGDYCKYVHSDKRVSLLAVLNPGMSCFIFPIIGPHFPLYFSICNTCTCISKHNNVGLPRLSSQWISNVVSGACPGPPPLEIEKQKKKVIRANIKLFHLYFATFLVKNVIFSASF